MPHEEAIDWLLEKDQPAIRYLTLTGLLEKTRDEPGVVEAEQQLTKRGWATEILSKQLEDGTWVLGENLYKPKYLSTNWMLLILSDLGLTKDNPRIAKASELWIKQFAKDDGGFAVGGSSKGHLCTTGNTARALVKFGYVEHPKVRASLDWLVKNQAEKGGWSCFGSGRNLDSWEGMSAFGAYPRERWTKSMKAAVERGAEFYLERELHKQGGHYEPWYRFHYPVHYYYDLLVGLDFMTTLGYGNDRRLKHAIGCSRRRSVETTADGTWRRFIPTSRAGWQSGIASTRSRLPSHSGWRKSEDRAG